MPLGSSLHLSRAVVQALDQQLTTDIKGAPAALPEVLIVMYHWPSLAAPLHFYIKG